MVYIHKDYLYVLGGEGGSGCVLGKLYGQHLNMFIRARITIDNDDSIHVILDDIALRYSTLLVASIHRKKAGR